MSDTLTVLTSLCYSCEIAKRLGCVKAVYPKFHVQNEAGLKYLVLGEAPGWEEAKHGEPFVGESGRLLRELFKKANIAIEDCLITNSCWCPPRDTAGKIGNPTPVEALNCLPHSLHYVRLYRPKVIVAVGGVPYAALCGEPKKGQGITKAHGMWMRLALPVLTRYQVFWMWVGENNLNETYPWAADEATQLAQIAAAASHGYDEVWLQTPVFPVIHPAYVLRSGRGRQEEILYFDLVKLRGAIDGTQGGLSIEEVHTKANSSAVEEALRKYRWIQSPEDFGQYVDETIQYYKDGHIKVISLDFETTSQQIEGLDTGKGINLIPFDPKTRILCFQVSRWKDEGVAVMVSHKLSPFNEPVAFQQIRHHLKRLLEAVPVTGQNFVFDAHVMKTLFGIEKFDLAGDTMLMDHWFNAGTKLPHDLDSLGARYVSAGLQHKQCYLDWQHANSGLTMEDAPLDILLTYAVGDTDVTLQVYYILRHHLEQEQRFKEYYDLHHGIHAGWPVVNALEWHGMTVDKTELDILNEDYPRRIDTCLQKFVTLWPVLDFIERRRIRKNTEHQTINDEIARNKAAGMPERRRPRRIFTFEDWLADRDNWYNPNSPQQTLELWTDVIKIPFPQIEDIEYNDTCPRCHRDKCKCKGEKYVNTNPSTDEHNRDVMRKTFHYWAKTEPGWEIVANLMDLLDEYKGLTKLYGTYVAGIYPLIIDKPGQGINPDPRTRCHSIYADYARFPRPWSIHPSYLMHGTETGRLSSREPNGQNFPKEKNDPTSNVKRPYVSQWQGKGGLLLQPDYSQIEVRVMVMLCQDEEIARQINEGKDIHKVVASMVHNVAYEKVTKELRGPCKRITFGILYGQGIASLAQDLQIPYKEAEALQERFFKQLPKVKSFVEGQHEYARKYGLVRSMFGRLRYLPDIRNEDEGKRSYAERCSVNTPIQSTASDMCWSAYGRAWQTIQRLGIQAVPFSIVHDSQAFDVSPGRWLDVAELQYYHMVYEPYKLWDWITVKPEADFDIGAGWGRLVGMKVNFDREKEPDHRKVAFEGEKDDIEALTQELHNYGERFEVLADHLHPKEEEAKLGKWWREVVMERPDPICWLEGRELKVRT